MSTNIGELSIGLRFDEKDFNISLKNVEASSEQAGNKISSVFQSASNAIISEVAIRAFDAVIGAAQKAASIVTNTISSSVQSFADYKQLIGGVETLFKDSSDIVVQYADAAYKTAGLSANQYMETVTSFSARLLQGLGGDTAEAARIADVAITDMADNANKMGTSISSIQDAYQGFAKQNYTMLDNLKLGYGGTQTEMARLINESGVLGDTIEVTAETVNNVSFDKMIEAIHVVQENMGITGTTALEASTTIQGSAASMKSAWENMLTGIADGAQDFDRLLANLTNSAITYASNLIPTIRVAISGFSELATSLAPMIPQIVAELTGAITDGNTIQQFTTAIMQLIQGVVKALPTFLKALVDMSKQIIAGITKELPALLKTIVEAVMELATLLTEPDNLQMMLQAGLDLLLAIVEAIPDVIIAIVNALPQIIDNIIKFLTDPGTLEMLIRAAVQLFMGLVEAIPRVLGALIGAVGNLIGSLISHIGSFIPDMISMAVHLGSEFLNNLISFFAQLPGNIAQFLGEVWNNVATWTSDMVNKAIEAGSQFLQSIVSFFTQLPSNVWNFLTQTISKVISFVGDFVSKAIQAGKDFFEGIVNKVEEIPGKMLEIGENIVKGIWEGISWAAGWLWDQITGFCSSIVDGIKDFFGINSPSTLFRDQVGIYLAQGLGEGFTEEMDKVSTEMVEAVAMPSPSILSEDIWATSLLIEEEAATSSSNAPLTVYMENNIDNSLDIDQVGNELLAQIRRVA